MTGGGIVMNKLFHEKMTALELHIANKIIDNKEQFVNMTISEFAKLANVSNAMLSKYAQNCGFSGFKEIRYYVKQTQDIQVKAQSDYIESKVMNYFLNFNESQLLKLKAECENCDEIMMYGEGPSHAFCNYMTPRMRYAFKKNVVSENDEQQLENEFYMPGKKLLILISASGNIGPHINSLRSARTKGIRTIIISEAKKTRLASECDLYINLLDEEDNPDHSIVRGRTLFFIYFETLVQTKCNQEAMI